MAEADTPTVALTGVSEVVLRKRKTLAEIKEKRQAQQKHKPAPKKKITFRRAEEFVRDHRARAKDTMRMQRVVKKQKALQDVGKPATAPEGKLALVVRVFPTKGACLKTRKILQHFRLWQLYSAVFVRLDEKSLAKLKQIEPYITWGTPTLKTTRELITKRGFAKVNKQRLPITDNAMIERELGEHGIVCTEDIVHEIVTGGENFFVANSFLWPMKLSTPKSGFDAKKYKPFAQGGDYGDRGDKINELVAKMN